MTTEGTRDGDSAALERLTALLTAATDTAPTARELAELLWLAGRLDTGAAPDGPRAHPAATTEALPATPATPRPPAPRNPTPAPAAPAATTPGDRVPLHLPTPPTGQPGTAEGPGGDQGSPSPLLAPAPPMLPRPLALQRALRPLKRTVPAPRTRLLDDRATADRIARLDAHPDVWLPVFRPARDRWLRLSLVHDTGPTMPVWRPLVRELHTVLAQSGVFRTVTLHTATPDGLARHVPDPGDGRTVTLVVSDCTGPQWHAGPAGTRWYRTLRHWASRMPLAVVQPLPEHLWPTTALPAEPGLLLSPGAAAPLSALTFTPYDTDTAPAPPGAVPLPVLEPGAPWLANWASLVASPGGGRVPGAAARLPVAPAPVPPDASVVPPAQDLVLRFRATASPEAFRLAGHLALAVPSVPVMRLVQRAVERDPRPQHLAEVILSGMLTAVPGPPGSYDFRPGVRDLLLRTLPRTARGRTRELLDRMGHLIDARAGLTAGEFRATPGGGTGTTAPGPAFATVSEETVRRLGGAPAPDAGLVAGRYRLLGRRGPGQRMWRAVDEHTDRPVVVHRYPPQPAPQERFLREAETLSGIEDPHVVRILDYGVEGETPYLVVEFVDGVTLTELIAGSRPGVSFPVFARLVCDGASGLRALHERGLVRGQEGANGLLFRPDGTVVLSRFALGQESRKRSSTSDMADFERLLRELAPHVPAVPSRHRSLLAQVAGGTVPSDAPAELAGVWERDLLRIRMLGPLRISRSAVSLPVPSPEAQALLCLLLSRPGRRMTNDELAYGLWDQPPRPRSVRRRVDVLAAELRRHLGPGTVAAVDDGYALHVPGVYVDAAACEDVLHHRSPDQNPSRRHELVTATLDLFYGDPLDGVPGPAAQATRARLRDLHIALRIASVELDVEMELFDRASTVLGNLLQEHPTHEAALRLRDRVVPPALPKAPPITRPTLLIETTADLTARPESRITLEYAVHEVLTRGALTAQQYEMRVRPDGYAVEFTPDAYLLPLLAAALRWLPGPLAELADPPRLRVTFRDGETPGAAPPDHPAPVVLTVPPALFEAFAGSSAAAGPHRFHPVYGDGPGAPPVAWYCPLPPAEEPRDLVRGPLITRDLRQLGVPAPGRTAVVHTRPGVPPALLDPAAPYGAGPRRPASYYEVDLTPRHALHHLPLPSSGKGTFTAAVALTWRVTDPVAFVRAEVTDVQARLLDHLAAAGPRITRHHSPRRPAGAQRALNSQLGRWPVPGVEVICTATLAPEHAPPPEVPGPGPGPAAVPLSELLADAETVLLGFDGPLTRLFPAAAARDAARDLMALVAEHRTPEDAPAGRTAGGRGATRELFVHPLDVLRAFAHDRLGPLLRDRLDELELLAVPDAPVTHRSAALVRALHHSGRRVGVVTDVCAPAVHRYLEGIPMPLRAGVHGRAADLTRLMPHPDCLRRALPPGDGAARTAVLIGSTVAELTAAQQVGLRFVGLARNPTIEQRLREAGCALTVPSLTPVLEAARAL
ncbi:SAV_2336 N-terminal domain-related protein [Streptomyces sp. Amel2xC10]|uniref:SAV_2336 N-terminal domain-related protein n=1 Tax=Streptomyces sp. Amel2xC10 TaxID=1305826 RepID=UPI000A08F294|nr:SAV_2336 N-terminal domain-related protein [Streptomyces sp. Amel2xC10]SMF83646.1 Serine/threonine protein kinase [Streptomyces sp. Amel2xC10]